jgi:hypothetical protein
VALTFTGLQSTSLSWITLEADDEDGQRVIVKVSIVAARFITSGNHDVGWF